MSAPNAQLCLPGQGNEIDFVGGIVDLALGVASSISVQQTDLNRGLKWNLSSREFGVFFQIGQTAELTANKGRWLYATPNTKIVFPAVLGEHVKASVTLAGDATAPSPTNGLPNAQLASNPTPFVGEIDYVGAIQQLTLGTNSTVVVQAADINRGLDWILSAGPYGVYFQVGLPAELTANTGRYFYCLPNQRIVYPAKLGEAVRASYLTDGSAAAPPTAQPLSPPVVIQGNANGVVPTQLSGTELHIIGADAFPARIQVNAYAGAPALTAQRANGSQAAPTHLNVDDNIWQINGSGYGTTGYGAIAVGLGGKAAESWTDAAQGSYWSFAVQLRGGIAGSVDAFRVNDDSSVVVGTKTFADSNRAGAGNFVAQGDVKGATVHASGGAVSGVTFTGGSISTTTTATFGFNLMQASNPTFQLGVNITNLSEPFLYHANLGNGANLKAWNYFVDDTSGTYRFMAMDDTGLSTHDVYSVTRTAFTPITWTWFDGTTFTAGGWSFAATVFAPAYVAPTIAGGGNANSALTIETTFNGSPSGDIMNLNQGGGTTIQLVKKVAVIGQLMTVAQLVAAAPAAAALKGARAVVSDATAPTFLGTLTGGGAVVCPVFCDGAAWKPG